MDRRNNNKGYAPNNCRWATRLVQANNKRSNVRVTYAGRTLSMADWARKVGMPRCTLRGRLEAGWTPKDALTKPIVEKTLLTHDGRTLSIVEWAKEMGIMEGTLRRRLRVGCSPKDALTTSVRGVLVTYAGLTLSVAKWARKVGIHANTIHHRLAIGWTTKDVLTKPSRKHRSNGAP